MTRPIIGSNYHPRSFERRDRNGTYAALHAPYSADALELQRSYLNEKYMSRASGLFKKLAFVYAVITVGVIAWALK